jgi:hypothetical protein
MAKCKIMDYIEDTFIKIAGYQLQEDGQNRNAI